jgi:hypothetical protein
MYLPRSCLDDPRAQSCTRASRSLFDRGDANDTNSSRPWLSTSNAKRWVREDVGQTDCHDQALA